MFERKKQQDVLNLKLNQTPHKNMSEVDFQHQRLFIPNFLSPQECKVCSSFLSISTAMFMLCTIFHSNWFWFCSRNWNSFTNVAAPWVTDPMSSPPRFLISLQQILLISSFLSFPSEVTYPTLQNSIFFCFSLQNTPFNCFVLQILLQKGWKIN